MLVFLKKYGKIFAGAELDTLCTEEIDKLDCVEKNRNAWCTPAKQCTYKPSQVCFSEYSVLFHLVSIAFIILMVLCTLH